ncbi:MAG: IclR family transcriptional regulator [Rhodospirillaceae bacterium]|nr:IclR family transcriptional regulator [Rhodospirillaceae bacterium]
MSPRRPFHELRGIQSIEIGCRLLAALVQAGGPLGLGDLAKAGAMSASKARRYLISFTRAGLIAQDADGRYDLGSFALRLGLAAQARVDVVRLGRPVLTELRDRLRETVAIVLWVDNRPTVVHIEETDRNIIRVVAPVGSSLSLLNSAGGMIFAAFLPPAETATLIEQELRENARAPRQLQVARTRAEADRLVAETKRRGVARAYPVVSTTICTLAVPVFDSGGDVVAALVALGYRTTFDAGYDGAIATALREAGRALSLRLGWAPTEQTTDPKRSRRGKN